MSLISRTRLSQPSRDRITVDVLVDDEGLGVELDGSSTAPPTLVRRLSSYFSSTSASSVRITFHSLRLSPEDRPDLLGARRFS